MRLSAMMRPPDAPATGWDGPAESTDMLERISHQLDLLDAAQTELVEIERASGLVDLDRPKAETQRSVAVTPPGAKPAPIAPSIDGHGAPR